ncbi:alpha/beta hydrolase [bacterium CPR1]|nr:alpha/beta hydrolase [bacterium CPR1]
MNLRGILPAAVTRFTAPLKAAREPLVAEGPRPEPSESIKLSGSQPRPDKPGRLGMIRQSIEAALEAAAQFATGPLAACACKVLEGKIKPAPAAVPASELGPLPAARVQRPVMFVPGFHTPIERFTPLVDKLSPDNGPVHYVRQGRFYADCECRQPVERVGPDCKLFVSVFSANNLAPDRGGADELAQNLEALRQVTGTGKVDVAAFSMGGLTTREYLDRGGEAVGKLHMVGTPNHGSGLARITIGLLEGKARGYAVDLLLGLKHVEADDEPALKWLAPNSPELARLNQRWAEQRSRLESARCFGTDLKATVGNRFMLQPTWGDGMVAASSLELPGMPVQMLQDKKYALHGNLVICPEFYLALRDHFGW